MPPTSRCIGTFTPGKKNISEAVGYYAVQAGFHDTRFKAISPSEVENTSVSVTLLDSPVELDRLEDWELGRDGLVVESRADQDKRAIYLPSVAVEQGWTREDTLENLLRKAGINKDERARIYSIPGYTAHEPR